jgi:NAD+ kinase
MTVKPKAPLTTAKQTRVFLIGNPEKKAAHPAFAELRALAETRCDLVGAVMGHDLTAAVAAKAERVIVLGGDGTLIGAARALGANQIPLIGVNVGKLGFLAEFSLEELKQNFDRALRDTSLISRRMVLHVELNDGKRSDAGLAINDCVIQAGPPFRMINLGVSINGEHLTDVAGDGLVVCTPSGSTAHSLSAGGPIMQPDVQGMILTPLNPHSLTHKPLVVEHDSVVEVQAVHVNSGTTVIIDGQVSHAVARGDRVTIRRSPTDFFLVRNPLYTPWYKLKNKLHWGRAPSYE